MKHLFLNEEYSRLLCYLGFNEACLAYWDESGFRLLEGRFGINTNEVWLMTDDSTVTAPTIGQAYEYFEKEFGLYGSVRPSLRTLGQFDYVVMNESGQTVSMSVVPIEGRENCYKSLLKRMCDEASKVKNKKKELI